MLRWAVMSLGLSFSEGLLASIPAAGGSYGVAKAALLLAVALLWAGHHRQRGPQGGKA